MIYLTANSKADYCGLIFSCKGWRRLGMEFSPPLAPARLLRRYKRFLADVEWPDGTQETVHVANPGSMLGMARPGARIWLRRAPSKDAKLRWQWIGEDMDGGVCVGVNTGFANRLVEDALTQNRIPALAGAHSIRREVAYAHTAQGSSRVDFFLEFPGSAAPLFLEVKSVTLARGGIAEFPDCVTARGAKHLADLAAEVTKGNRAALLFCVQRDDCSQFQIAADLDPAYARAFDAARNAGVEVLCYAWTVRADGIYFARSIEMIE